MPHVRHHRPASSGRIPRVVCVVGPTASGKTALGIKLARQFAGEVVNADARQCYKVFDIGTGKPEGKRGAVGGRRAFVVDGVPHYLMDFLEPSASMTVAEWREIALTAVRGIAGRHHLPIVVGGTGLYIQSLIDNFSFPKVEPQLALRKAFAQKPLEDLVKLLIRLDPVAAEAVDLKNPRRVVRALEVVTFTGKPFTEQKIVGKPVVEAFQVGIRHSREELYRRVNETVENMIEQGWIDEIREIIQKKIPLDAPAMTSIGYRELLSYIKGEQSLEAAIDLCKKAVRHYAKRQETWFKRDKRIHWVTTEDEGIALVAEWLKSFAND